MNKNQEIEEILKSEDDTANENITEISPEELLAISSGKDAEKRFYRSTGDISINEIISKEEVKTISNAPLNCEFNFFCEGGAIVVQCDFEKEYIYQSTVLMNICKEHVTDKQNNPNSNTVLSVMIFPILLRGDVYFTLMGLTYFCGIDLGMTKRVVLVFDNTLTQVYADNNIDFETLQLEVDAELRQEETEIEKEIYEVEQEIKETEKEIRLTKMTQSNLNSPLDLINEKIEEQEEAESIETEKRSKDIW